MKLRKHILRAGAVCALLLATAAASAQTVSLKCFVWNVLSFEQTDKSGEQNGFRIAEYVEVIKEQNPDIVCLNELETGTSRMGQEKLTELAAELGMYPYFVMSYPKDTGYYGNAILSKYPILSEASKLYTYQHYRGEGNYQWNSGWQNTTYGSDQRSIGYIEILVPTSETDGKIVRVACTHFDHVGGHEIQRPEAVAFLELENPPYPTLLLGDLNTTLGGLPEFDALGDQAATNWVDHIWTFPKGKWTSKDRVEVYTGKLSDHYPVIKTVELK